MNRIAVVAAGLLAALSSGAHSVGKITEASAYKALPVPVAVEAPATLVPLTLGAPTPQGDELFGRRVMQFGLALDRASRDPGAARELPSLEAALTGVETAAMLGPDAAASMRELVQVARQSANAPPLDQASVTSLDMAVARLDNSLLSSRLPYFVDATVMTDLRHGAGPRRIIVLSEFSIAESSLYASNDGAFVRTVRVRRLDRLNFKHNSLGFVNPHRAQAAVLLDVVDDQVTRHLAPALADDAMMPLVASEGTLSAPMADLAARAGEDARAELGALPGVDREALRDLGATLGERRRLYEGWKTRLDAEDREALQATEAHLASEALAKAYASVRDAVADSVERHEVQHRLDLKHASVAEPLPVPAPVSALIRGDSQRADELRDAVKSELSGYVAQIARDDRLPRTTLAMLLRFLVNPRTRSSTEAYVAMIATEELCKALAIQDVSPLVHDGHLDEERLARAHRELTSVPPKELTGAAAAVWGHLFGRPLPSVERGR
jgi:hypothetical protein